MRLVLKDDQFATEFINGDLTPDTERLVCASNARFGWAELKLNVMVRKIVRKVDDTTVEFKQSA